MATFKKNNRLGVVKEETTAGTAVNFATADFDVRLRNLELSSLTTEMDEDSAKFATGDHTGDPSIPGITKAEISFDVKLAPGELTPLTASKLPYGKLLKTAGLIETYTGDLSSVGTYTYTPGKTADSNTASVAIYDFESGAASPVGIEYKIAGAMSTLSIGCEGTGKPFMANFSYQGKVAGVTNVNPAFPSYSDDDGLQQLADTFKNATVSIDAVDQYTGLPAGSPLEFCASSFQFDLQSTITSIECQSEASGIIHETITERKPKLSINPRLLKLGTWDFWANQNAATLYEVKVHGTNVQLTLPRCQLMSTAVSDDAGFFRNALEFRALRNIAGSTQAEKEATFSLAIGEVDVTA